MNRRWVIILGLLALLIVTAFLTGRPPRDEAGPDGILALRRYLDRMGMDVIDADSPPREGTFFLPYDFRGEEESDRLLEWARDGGKLVVGSPFTRIARSLSVDSSPGAPGRYTSIVERPPSCATAETAGVVRIAARGSDFSLLAASPEAVSCFSEGAKYYAVHVSTGKGKVIVLGGMSAFTNANLARAGNALFAHQLLASDGPLVFGPPVAAGRSAPRGIWAALPTAAKIVVLQLGLALVIFALVRGRRLGRPVPEEPMSPIPAGELVTARAELLRQARAAPFATNLLRKRAARRLAKRIGMSAEADPETLSRLVARNAEEVEHLMRLFGSTPPESEERLLELAREIEEEVRKLEEVRR